MHSIDRNQPETNRENLSGGEAIERIRTTVGRAPNCFFSSAAASTSSLGTRPMNVREVDERGHLWFLSPGDSQLNREIAEQNQVTLYFQGGTHADFLVLRGTAAVSRERARIEALWEPILKTWFTEGSDDPRITVIEVKPEEGYYWDTKHGGMVAGMKMFLGTMLGTTLDDSIQGKLQP